MAFRGKEMMKKLVKKVGSETLTPELKEKLKACVPDSKVVMGRAKRGLYAGRHIQYGNRVSEDGGNKSRRCWKPNVQEKRLFSYIFDRHIKVKVTTHALRCIDKAGGIDEYLLKTPYQKMDTEMGLFWKTKVEQRYAELGQMEVAFFTPEDEAKFEQGFKDLNIAKKDARREARKEARRKIYGDKGGEEKGEGEGEGEGEEASLEAGGLESHQDDHGWLEANA